MVCVGKHSRGDMGWGSSSGCGSLGTQNGNLGQRWELGSGVFCLKGLPGSPQGNGEGIEASWAVSRLPKGKA